MRLLSLVSALALATALASPAEAQTPAPAAARPEIPTQLPRSARPLHYAIDAVPDAANLRFSATATIDIEVIAPTAIITLNAVDLNFASATLDGAPAQISTDGGAQTASFTLPSPVAVGRHQLVLNYSGPIGTQAAGLFALDYQDGDQPKRALFTQFEAPDARRFFPGWDEPNFRTPYDLSVTVPAGQDAIGNMPAARRETLPDGRIRVTFQTTPPMSSYLLFLGVGEFDRITTRAGNTEIGVVARRGAGEQGRWALESAARILPWYNEYFGTPFPLPKLDNVAGPGSSQFFSAMENWGAIFSFENILLVDPAITSEARRQAIFEVAAHEMAHQWFGDLVTMAWWDDLWLNEGFASWMATKSTSALHPEWQTELSRIDGREGAMRLDSLQTTHPVVQHVTTVEQISQAFDAITYDKGEAVITMLENYVGDDAWRTGVRAYIARHRLGNTQTDDLWNAVEQAANQPVTAIAHDFTLQPGVPLIRVEAARCVGGNTQVTFRQGQFSRDNPDGQPLTWRVPIVAAAGGEAARTLVQNGSGQANVPGCGTLVVNYGQAGYYRTLYTPELLGRLTTGFGQLRPIDQNGLLADTWALGLAGYQPASAALDMVAAAPADANARLWTRIAGIFQSIDAMYADNPAERAIAARYAAAKLDPVLQRLGWAPRANEPATDAVLRATLIAALGDLGDPMVVAEANRRFAADDPSVTAGPLRETWLDVVATQADAATWERLHAMAAAERNPLVKGQLYGLLGAARDPGLAQRALDLALTEEPGATNSARIISAVSVEHPEIAFDFALANQPRVETLVDSSSRSRFLPQLAQGSADPATIGKLRLFAEQSLTPESRAPADRAIASIEDRIRVRRDRLPAITQWFDQHTS